jgi:hypothetical protein
MQRIHQLIHTILQLLKALLSLPRQHARIARIASRPRKADHDFARKQLAGPAPQGAALSSRGRKPTEASHRDGQAPNGATLLAPFAGARSLNADSAPLTRPPTTGASPHRHSAIQRPRSGDAAAPALGSRGGGRATHTHQAHTRPSCSLPQFAIPSPPREHRGKDHRDCE